MSPAVSRLRIGLLPFYVNYYEGTCPRFPIEKAEVAARCAQRLARHGELLWDGALITDVDQATAAGKSMAAQKPDCVVVVTTIAVFSGICEAALAELQAPILIWNPQLISTVGAGYSMEEIVRNTSQIGTQALANALMRANRPFRIVTGYEHNERTEADLKHYFAVQSAVQSLRRARLLSVGGPFPLMTDIHLDEHDLGRRLGAQVRHVSIDELTAAYHAVPEARVDARMAQLRRDNTLSDLTDDAGRRSARLSLAFDGLVEAHQADAGSFNCHGGVCLRNPAIGVTACLSHGLQNSAGRPFTCTGDLPTALAMLLFKKLTGIAMYTEVQVMDEVRNAIVIANSGEGEDGIRRTSCRSGITGNTNFTGLHGRGASFAYALAPGPATLLSLTPTQTGFRLIAAEGEILEETLPDAGALAGFFRFSRAALHDGYTRWMQAGAIHHAATTPGLWHREIAEIATLLGFESVLI